MSDRRARDQSAAEALGIWTESEDINVHNVGDHLYHADSQPYTLLEQEELLEIVVDETALAFDGTQGLSNLLPTRRDEVNQLVAQLRDQVDLLVGDDDWILRLLIRRVLRAERSGVSMVAAKHERDRVSD